MTPFDTQLNEEKIRRIIRDELSNVLKIDKYIFDKNIQILDMRNIQLGLDNGTKIGTAAAQKVALHGATPTIQSLKINDPSGGTTVDAEARTAINSIIDVLEAKGLSASS